MRKDAYICDVCGITKQEANHWFKGYVMCDGPLVVGKETKAVGFLVVPWTTEVLSHLFGSHALPEADAHLCGQQHAIEWANAQLSKSS